MVEDRLNPMASTDPGPVKFVERSEKVGPYAFVWPEDDDISRELTINQYVAVITEHDLDLN